MTTSSKPQDRLRILANARSWLDPIMTETEVNLLYEVADLVDRLEAAKETHDQTKLTAFRALAERYESKMAQLEAERDRLREALQLIADKGSDCPPAMTEDEFNEGQFRSCRSIARKALAEDDKA